MTWPPPDTLHVHDVECPQIDDGDVGRPHHRHVGQCRPGSHCDATRVPAHRDPGNFDACGHIEDRDIEPAPVRDQDIAVVGSDREELRDRTDA